MKTKQLIVATGFALLIATAGAQQQVSLQEVRMAAVSSLKSRTGLAIDEQAIDTIFALKNSRNNTLMYECRFNDGKVVLMSGSKACIPVLGYYDSFTEASIFDPDADISCCFRDFLSEYQEQIEICFANDTITLYKEAAWQRLQGSSGSTARAGLSTIDNEIVKPLITSKWNQDKSNDNGLDCNAYNYYVTDFNTVTCISCAGNKCPAGCVAVAMAQVMNYWKYPLYDPLLKYRYDWCNATDKLLTTSSNYVNERNAVSRLLRDCGIYVNMNYCSGNSCQSAASTSYARDVFIDYFGYSAGPYQNKSAYSDENDWKNKIKTDLDACKPICYRGSGAAGGHAFVCDGYGTNNGYDYFHFNWGWAGGANGWFTIDDLIPYSGYNFTSGQAAIFNLYPNPTNLQNYCNYSMPLSDYYKKYYSHLRKYDPDALLPIHKKTPKIFADLVSASISDSASWRTISAGDTVVYEASKSITLKSGFTAQAGSEFTMRIVPCDTDTCVHTSSKSTMVYNDDYLLFLEDDGPVVIWITEEPEESITAAIEENLPWLGQNHPNPFTGETMIPYYLPEGSAGAYLRIINTEGIVLQTVNITQTGESAITLAAHALPPGVYFYSLLINGQVIDTKRMIVE